MFPLDELKVEMLNHLTTSHSLLRPVNYGVCKGVLILV